MLNLESTQIWIVSNWFPPSTLIQSISSASGTNDDFSIPTTDLRLDDAVTPHSSTAMLGSALPICFDGLSAWKVRRPSQTEILSFGLACFRRETAVPGQTELVDAVSFFLNNYHSLCTNFFLFFIFILSFNTSISIQWHLEYFSHFIWSTFYFSLCFPSLFAFRYLSCWRLFFRLFFRSFLFAVFSFAIFSFGHFNAYPCTIIITKYKWKVWSSRNIMINYVT